MQYTFQQQVKVIMGAGSVQQIGQVLEEAGYAKAFLIFDKTIKKIGLIDKIETSLQMAGVDYVEYDNVLPDPPAECIDAGAALCKREQCDCVIGVGGGSSIDTAKGINILRFNEGTILDYATKPMQLCSGLITVPTTAGTGSELSNGAIISDIVHDRKVPILCFNNMSEYTILDPELTQGMPYNLTLMTGLDVFSHAAEAYTTNAANTMTDLICEKVMAVVVENLPKVLENPNNLQARANMQCAASMGGWMLYHSGSHVGHSIAHVLGAHFHIPHGAACAYGLPSVLKMIAPVVPKKVAYIGALLGVDYTGKESPNMIGDMAAEAYQHFVETLQLPALESQLVSNELCNQLADGVMQEPFTAAAPLSIEKETVLMMLQEILQK